MIGQSRPAGISSEEGRHLGHRPRGFVEAWKPRPRTAALIEIVRQVLVEYTDYLPLTLRQIFYRLVAMHEYEKTEQAYERLGDHLVKARRARLIPWSAIRDDGVIRVKPTSWESADEFIEAVGRQVPGLMMDRQAGQARRLWVWCEAAGVVPQLERVTAPFGVEVLSSGGFDSATIRHALAEEWAGLDTTLLHIGDHDPSGVHIMNSLFEDLAAFGREYRYSFDIVRVAVRPEQARELNLPSAPPKATDKRSFAGAQTWQAEALPPDVLMAMLRRAIEERIDRVVYDRVLEAERWMRAQILETLFQGPR
jgi:hypothetical protein